MSSIKLLKGFRNPISEEMNTISLLLKSNLDFNEHIKSVRVKLLKALTCILENYGRNYKVNFHHKIVVAYGRRNEYLATNDYFTSLAYLKKDLNSSLNEAIRMTYGKKASHFVNIKMVSKGKVVELSKREFIDLNSKIISSISINNDEYIFIDNNEKVKPSKNNEKVTSVKPIKKAIPSNECLFIDSDDDDDNNDEDYVEHKKVDNNECLFIDSDEDDDDDDDDVKQIKKRNQSNECLFIDSDDDHVEQKKADEGPYVGCDLKRKKVKKIKERVPRKKVINGIEYFYYDTDDEDPFDFLNALKPS